MISIYKSSDLNHILSNRNLAKIIVKKVGKTTVKTDGRTDGTTTRDYGQSNPDVPAMLHNVILKMLFKFDLLFFRH